MRHLSAWPLYGSHQRRLAQRDRLARRAPAARSVRPASPRRPRACAAGLPAHVLVRASRLHVRRHVGDERELGAAAPLVLVLPGLERCRVFVGRELAPARRPEEMRPGLEQRRPRRKRVTLDSPSGAGSWLICRSCTCATMSASSMPPPVGGACVAIDAARARRAARRRCWPRRAARDHRRCQARDAHRDAGGFERCAGHQILTHAHDVGADRQAFVRRSNARASPSASSARLSPADTAAACMRVAAFDRQLGHRPAELRRGAQLGDHLDVLVDQLDLRRGQRRIAVEELRCERIALLARRWPANPAALAPPRTRRCPRRLARAAPAAPSAGACTWRSRRRGPR